MSQPASALPSVTDDERTMATLAHALQTVGWWIAPLIILLLKRESRFVRLHAGQALLLQLCMVLVWVVCMVAFFAFVLASVPMDRPPHTPVGPPPGFIFLFPLIWLGMMSWWVIMLVLAVVYAIKAGRGEWARYPLIGGLAAKVFNAEPPLSPQPPNVTGY